MPPVLDSLFARQRRRLRRVLRWELLARVVAAAAAAWWMGLLLDWWLEPTVSVRQGAMLAAGFGVLLWVARTTVEPLFRPISDRQIATLIEHRQPAFGDSLLTAIDLSTRPPVDHDRELETATHARALRVLQQTGEPRVVSSARAFRWARAAGIGLAAIALFCVFQADAAKTYARRLALSPEPWPRSVFLTVDGFTVDDDGVARRKVARGESVEIVARASLLDGLVAPETVWLRYEFEAGARGRESFARIGEPTAGPEAHQLYRHLLTDVRSNVRLSVRGGDGRVGPLEVVVAPRPVVTSAEFQVFPPEYLNRPAWRTAAAAADPLPEGSAITVHFVASKPVASVEASWASPQDGGLPPTVDLRSGSRRFQVSCPALDADRVLQVSLVDTDGIASAAPHPTPISVRPDRRPRVALRLVGIGPAITPDADIKMRVTLEDDHGVASAAVGVEVDDAPALERVLDAAGAGKTRRTRVDLLTERFAAGRDAGRLQPGQRLSLSAAATDACDLRDEDRRVTSQRFTLEIVTPDQLLARIEQREVNLRKAFEQTVADMRRISRVVAAWEAEAQAEAQADAAEPPPGRRRLRVARTRDQVAQALQETFAAAEAFAAIHQELVSNRIGNSDLLERIDGRIAGPLGRLAEGDFKRLLSRLRTPADPSDPPAVDPTLAALGQSVVGELVAILDQMQSLETYNEVLALLRGVIGDQQRVQRATEKTRREQVKRLLFE